MSSRDVSQRRCPRRLRVAPRFHDLRHSHVAYLISASWDFYAIQRRLGHASVRTTFDAYGHLLAHGEQGRLACLDQLLPIPQAMNPARPTADHRSGSSRFAM